MCRSGSGVVGLYTMLSLSLSPFPSFLFLCGNKNRLCSMTCGILPILGLGKNFVEDDFYGFTNSLRIVGYPRAPPPPDNSNNNNVHLPLACAREEKQFRTTHPRLAEKKGPRFKTGVRPVVRGDFCARPKRGGGGMEEEEALFFVDPTLRVRWGGKTF